jgi:ABC-type lipoprotein export system ATPase subunit
MNDTQILLAATDVQKSFRIGRTALQVLRGVDVSVSVGDFVALCGASGSGKTTLLHLLGGLDEPDRGNIRVGEIDLARMSRQAVARFRNKEIGFVFQAYHLLPELDALENVALPARMARRPVAEAEVRAKKLLARVGLAQRMEHRPNELSGGEQQRVAIARALINEPRLVLADEPTGNLDSATGEEIISLLADLHKEQEVTLIVATHDEKVAAHAERVLRLADGCIVD